MIQCYRLCVLCNAECVSVCRHDGWAKCMMRRPSFGLAQARDELGETPLMRAAEGGSLETARFAFFALLTVTLQLPEKSGARAAGGD